MYKPVIIIGAPRSGTNMLRDIICKLPDCGTWPCDEINYIWRHGNARYPSDCLPVESATTSKASYIKGHFDRLARRKRLKFVIEKTCANSLRVGFVNRVIPEAKYIFIVRNGVDTVASAMKRWKADLDIPYLLKKANYVPLSDLPYYASRYIGNRIYRLFSKDKKLAFWGPHFNNLEEYLKKCSLAQVCAHQWQQCVQHAEQDFSLLPPDNIHRIRYEDFVVSPSTELSKILSFLGVKIPDGGLDQLVEKVSANSVGRGSGELGKKELKNILEIIEGTLLQYDYHTP